MRGTARLGRYRYTLTGQPATTRPSPTGPAPVGREQELAALLLSELGKVLAGPTRAPTVTKRLGNLLHGRNWQAQEIESWLVSYGVTVAATVPEGQTLCILDGSVLEKPESTQADEPRSVRSSNARRLSWPRPKLAPRYDSGPPGTTVVIPRWLWLAPAVARWAEPEPRRPLTLGAW